MEPSSAKRRTPFFITVTPSSRSARRMARASSRAMSTGPVALSRVISKSSSVSEAT